MASKDVIETNKLKIGSGSTKGLYVGSAESKYAVLSDSAKSQTVIYDKVHYDFTVTDLSTTVPASGGTYTISASQSTRTHGNGTVDTVTFSPTSVTIPANTGSSYSSAVTVTQTTSNLTDNYNFSVAGDAVKSIVLTLSNPAVIPASGGSVSSCTTSATVTYNSGRQITTFTPTKIQWGTAVSAGTKGTTVSSQNSAGTLTCYVEYGGVRSNTASITVNQAANAVTSSGLTEVGCTSPTNNSSLGEIAAGGGSKTPTLTATGGTAWTAYTSTSTASTTPSKSWSVAFTNSGNFTLKSSTTGQISASTKGTTMSNVTTSNTATATVTVTANGVTRTASTKYYVTQAFNHIVSATATTSSTGTHISYANIGPAATSAAPTKNGACTLTYSSGSNSKVTSSPAGASIAWNRTYTLASSQNGFTAVNTSGTLTATSLGTTISNARTSAVVTSVLTPVITHTADYGGSVVSATSMTCQVTCTQNGNYVTGITVANQALSIAEIHASGGTKTDTGSDGTVTYKFTTGQSTTTKPGDTYGSLTTTTSYSMTASGRFTLTDAVNGTVSATTKGTSVEGVTSSNTITKTVNHSWAHSTTYSAGGTVTTSGTTTGKATQGKNEIVSYTGHSGLSGKTISASKVPAGGGTSTITWTGTASATRQPVYTSTATGSSVSYNPTVSTAVTGNSAVASKGITISNETTAIATVTGYYWADGLTASTTTSVKQNGNYVTGLTATDPTLTIAQIAAAGGSKTDTGGAGTLTFKFTSGSSTGTTPANTYGTLSTVKNYTIASTSNGFSVANATTGAIGAESKGTTISNVTTSDTITKSVTYTWTPTASYDSAGEKTLTKTKTGTATQAGNYVSSLTYTTNPTVVYSGAIPASGGTKSDSGTLGAIKVTYTSTSTGTTFPESTFGTSAVTSTYSMTSGNGFTIATGTGVVSATSKGTTDSNTTTSNTVTKTVTYTWTPTSGYNAGGSKTVSKDATGTATQGANSHSNEWNNPVVTLTYPSGKIAAVGGSKTPTVSATQSGVATFTSTATASTSNTSFTYSYEMPTTSGFSLNTSTGVVSADNRTTALGNDRSSGTITVTATGAGSKTGTKTATVTQEANYVVSIAATGSSTNGAHFSYANVAASATTAPVTLNGSAKYTYTSGSVGTSAPTAGTATYSRTYSLASSGNGFTAVNTAGTLTCTARGTEIGNARTSSNVTSVLTVTYTHPSGISGGTVTSPTYSKTNTCTQEGNYVTAITVASQAIAYETIPAGGGSKTPTGSNGTVTYAFSSKSTTTSTPASSAGSLTSSVSYAMTNSGRFTLKSSSTGEVSATTKGTSIENVTSSDTVTKTVSYTWTPASGYNAAGTKTVSGTATTKAKQAGNYVASLTVTTAPSLSYANTIPAGGGTIDASGSAGVVSYTFTSGDNTATAPTTTFGSLTTPTAYSMATGGDSRITLKSTSTGQLSGTTKGTTDVDITSSGTVTKTVTFTWTPTANYNGGGTITKTATATAKGKQAANTHSDSWNNPTVSTFTYSPTIAASGGTATPSVTVATQSGTRTWTSTSTSALTNTSFTYAYSMTASGRWTIASDGKVSATTRGTTSGESESSPTVTVTVTGSGNKTGTKTATATQAANTYTDSWNNPTVTTFSYATTIPAGGGSCAPTVAATQTGTRTWTSTSTSAITNTSFTYSYSMTASGRWSISGGTVSATTRGTTTGASESSPTVTVTATGAGNKTNTKTATATQAANNIESTKYNEGNSAWTATISIGSGIHASGGTATVTSSANHIHYWQQKYTSGSFVASSYTNTVTDTANVTEDSDPNNRFSYSNGTLTHTTMGTNATTDSCTLRVRNASNTATTKTASVSATNAITGYTDYQTPSGVTISSSIVPASGGTSTITFSPNTCSQKAKAVYTSKATASTYTTLTGVAYTTSVAGNTSVASKGTTPSNQTTAIATVTGTYTANGKSSTTTTSVSQAANYVTSVVASGISGSDHFYYPNISPSATTASAVNNGGAYYTFTSGGEIFDSSSSPSFGGSASYTRSNYRWASASGNGFTAVNSSTGALTHTKVTTTITNAVTSPEVKGDLKVVYTHANGINGGTVSSDTFTSTVTCTMNGNYVTGITVNTAPTVTYSTFPASGSTQTAGGSSGSCKYWFTSGSSSSTKPTAVTTSVSSNTYSCTSIGTGFSKGTSFASDGSVTAADRGTDDGNARSTGTITRTVKYKCVHNSTYSAGGTVSCSTTCTTTATQQANSHSDSWNNPSVTLSYSTTIPAGGGSCAPTVSATQSGTRTWTSTSTSAITNTSFTYSYSMTASGRWSIASNGTVSATSRGTTAGSSESSPTVTVTATGSGSKTGTDTATATQQANTLSTTWGDVTISTFIYATDIPASGGSVLPTVTASQSGTYSYTSGSSGATSNTPTKTFALLSSGSTGYSNIKSGSTFTSDGKVSATTRSTTVGAAQTRYVKLTATGEGSKSATASTYVTRQKNEVTGYTDYQNPSGLSITCMTLIPASGGSIGSASSNVVWSGTCKQKAKAVYTSNSTASSYTDRTISDSEITKSYESSYLFSDKGTTLSNQTTESNGVMWKYTVNGKTTTVGAEVTQAANLITALTTSANAVQYSSTIPASGGTCAESGSDGSITKYWYTSGSSGSSIPTGTSGGTTGKTASWSVPRTASTTWTFTDNNGTISVESRGTNIGSDRSVTVTEEIYYTYTHHSAYGGGTVSSLTRTATGDVTQAANTSAVTYSTPSVSLSYPSGSISAGGGTKTPLTSVTQTKTITYTSGVQSQQSVTSTFGKSFTMTNGNGFFINGSTGVVTAEDRANLTGSERTSNNIKMYAWANNVTGSSSNVTVKQEANAVVSTWWDDVVIQRFEYAQIPASGGTATPSIGIYDQEGTVTYTSGFVDDAINSDFTYSFSAGDLGYNFTKDTNFATNGKVSAPTRGTTAGSYYLGEDVTITVTGEGGRNTTAEAPVTQQQNAIINTTGGSVSVITFSYDNVIPASGGSVSPRIAATQSYVWQKYTSNATTSFTASYEVGGGLLIPTFEEVDIDDGMVLENSGIVSAGTRLTVAGETKAATVKLTITGVQNKSGNKTTQALQEGNSVCSLTSLTTTTISATWPTAPSSGGSLSPSAYYANGSVKIAWKSNSQETITLTSSNIGTAYNISTSLNSGNWISVSNATSGTLTLSANTSSLPRSGIVNVTALFGGTSYPTVSALTITSTTKGIQQAEAAPTYTLTRSSTPRIQITNNKSVTVQVMYLDIYGVKADNSTERFLSISGSPIISQYGTTYATVQTGTSPITGCTHLRVSVTGYTYGASSSGQVTVSGSNPSLTTTSETWANQSSFNVNVNIALSENKTFTSSSTIIVSIT